MNMKHIKGRCFIYIGIIASLATLATILSEFIGNTWFNAISTFLIYFTLCMVLIDVGKSINKNHVRKKYVRYVCIFASEIAIILLISYMLGVGTHNTWLGLIGANVIFLTVIIMLIDIKKSIKPCRSFAKYAICFVSVLILMGLVINNIAFLAGVFTS